MSQKTNSPAYGRIHALLDGNSFVELGAYITARSTDFNLTDVPTPADGVITGYGTVGGNLVYIYSQDATVLGGSMGEMHAKKIAGLYDMAMKMGAPIVGIIDCAGLRLQEATDALDGFGQLYRKQAAASGVIPQIQAIFGSCGGGLSISASMADFVYMEEKKAKLFVTAPNAVLGNHLEKEDTASADFKAREAGMVDFAGSSEEIFEGIKTLISVIPSSYEDNDSFDECTDDLNRLVDIDGAIGDAALVLTHLSDHFFFYELKKEFAPEMVTAFIRLNGVTVGCVANRSKTFTEDGVKAEYPKELTAKGARKAARFVEFCDAFSIPVLTLVDVNGFAKTRCSEKHLSKDVAKLTYAFANATVPKVTLVLKEAVGSAYLSMNSKSIGADVVYALKDSYIGMMDAELAAKIMYADEIEKSGDKAKLIREKADLYKELQASSLSAARRGYVDDIIESSEARKRIIASFEMLFTKKEDRIAKKHGTV